MSGPWRRVRGVATRFAIAVAWLYSTPAASDPPNHEQPQLKPSSEQILRSLGPGPLHAPVIDRPAADPGKAASLERRIDRCVENEMARFDAPGAAVAVLLDGELLYESGYGVKRRGLDDPVDPGTVFRIGSITKQMTAAAVMQQVEAGRVRLDSSVTEYLPEFQVAGRWPAELMAVRHTLTHTAAFPDWIDDYGGTGDAALSDWAARQGNVRLHAPPGSFWNYSNPNFMIAGLVAERASGVPYRDLLEQSLWRPAGLDSTTFDPIAVIFAGNFSYGHYYDAEQNREYILGPRDNDSWTAGPAGFAFSTVRDLVRWALILMDGGPPVLAPASAAAMQAPQVWTNLTPDLHYGFGIVIEDYQGLDVRQHGGNVAGFGSFLLWVPERRFAVAVLTNVTWSLIRSAYCIVDEVLDPAPREPPDLTTDPATWGRYVGDYLVTESDGRQWLAEISLDDDRLMSTVSDPNDPGAGASSELVQAYLDTFRVDSDGDGALDTDFTFVSRKPGSGFVTWIRNRHAVGERQLRPRAASRRVAP